MENNEIYEKLLKKYTLNKQYVVAIEELAELQKELTKAIRSHGDIDHTAEEIADVEIMIEQLKYYNRESQLSQKVEYWKLKQTLTEIKEIAEYCYYPVDKENDGFWSILQKISECEVK